MRVLFFGDMAATGFGTVTMDLGRRLLDLGEDVRFFSLNEQEAMIEPFASRTLSVLSLETAELQPDFIDALVREGTSPANLWNGEAWGTWKPDAVIMLGDFTAARMFATPYLETFATVPTYHYCPIEGVGLPLKWKELWDVIHPVAMSKFGQTEIAKVIGVTPPLIYHGVDSDLFHPVAEKPLTVSSLSKKPITLSSKDECKAAFGKWLGQRNGIPIRRKWLLRTDRHMPRKKYNAMLRALVPPLLAHPEWCLVLHCSAFDQGGYLPDTISKLPVVVQSQILLTNYRGMPRDLLVALYNAADIYVSTSAEGFGLTNAEALACGVPVVGADYSAVPEVIGKAGVVVGGGLLDNEYDHYWFTVDEEAFGTAVEGLMTSRRKREHLGSLGPRHIRDNFRWDRAARQFRDLLHSDVVTQSAA